LVLPNYNSLDFISSQSTLLSSTPTFVEDFTLTPTEDVVSTSIEPVDIITSTSHSNQNVK